MKKYFAKQHYKLLLLLFFVFNIVTMSEEADSLSSSMNADTLNCPPNSSQLIPALNFKDTDIRDILRGIALEYKTNIAVDNSINKKVSAALFNVSVFDAVQIIAEDNGYEFSYDDKRFFVNVKKPEPPPPPVEHEPEITFYKTPGKIDINAQNVDINKFVEELRKSTGYNYLLTAGTSGKITGKLKSVDFRIGLRNMLQNNGFYFAEKDSIYYISRSAYFSSVGENAGSNNGVYWVSIQNNLITLDVNDAEVNKVLDDITNQLNLQIIKLDVPDNKITIKCNAVPLEQALCYLFNGSEFTFKKDKETYIIGSKTSKTLETVKLVKLKNLRADKIIEKIPQKSFPSVSIQPVIEHNGLLLNGLQESITAFEEYITAIDKPVPQVMIEALVVDYDLENLFEAGLSAGTDNSVTSTNTDQWFPGLDVTASGKKINSLFDKIGSFELFGNNIDLSKVTLPDDFYATLKFLETEKIADVKSRPILCTLNGHTASLETGSTQNYIVNRVSSTSTSYVQNESIETIEANISFEITPWVGPNNELTLELKPSFETPVGTFSPDKDEIPTINTRSLESTVKLKDGETIVIGGLIEETISVTESKMPLLGDIPILGQLFTSTNKDKGKSELMIYVTPRIFYEDEYGYASYDYAE
ncbi:MAG: hypothetical protein PVH88_24525 [Ignavibacteria bacterium]